MMAGSGLLQRGWIGTVERKHLFKTRSISPGVVKPTPELRYVPGTGAQEGAAPARDELLLEVVTFRYSFQQ